MIIQIAQIWMGKSSAMHGSNRFVCESARRHYYCCCRWLINELPPAAEFPTPDLGFLDVFYTGFNVLFLGECVAFKNLGRFLEMVDSS